MCCVTKGILKVALVKIFVKYSLSITPRSPKAFLHFGLLQGNKTEKTKVKEPAFWGKPVLEEFVLGKPQ